MAVYPQRLPGLKQRKNNFQKFACFLSPRLIFWRLCRSSAPPMTNRNPRPLSHVSSSPGSHQIQGMMSPTMMSPSSPPLSPVNMQASMLFDYPLHPTFPRREHMPALISGFFEHFATYMPFLQQGDITARAKAGRLWNIHALAIAALASRYDVNLLHKMPPLLTSKYRFSSLSVHSSDLRGDHSNIYLSMAKVSARVSKIKMTLSLCYNILALDHAIQRPDVPSGPPRADNA